MVDWCRDRHFILNTSRLFTSMENVGKKIKFLNKLSWSFSISGLIRKCQKLFFFFLKLIQTYLPEAAVVQPQRNLTTCRSAWSTPGIRPAAPPWTLRIEVNAVSATAIWKTYQGNKILQKEHNPPKKQQLRKSILLQNIGFHFPRSLTTQNNIPNTFLIVIMSHWSTFLKELYINAQ